MHSEVYSVLFNSMRRSKSRFDHFTRVVQFSLFLCNVLKFLTFAIVSSMTDCQNLTDTLFMARIIFANLFPHFLILAFLKLGSFLEPELPTCFS